MIHVDEYFSNELVQPPTRLWNHKEDIVKTIHWSKSKVYLGSTIPAYATSSCTSAETWSCNISWSLGNATEIRGKFFAMQNRLKWNWGLFTHSNGEVRFLQAFHLHQLLCQKRWVNLQRSWIIDWKNILALKPCKSYRNSWVPVFIMSRAAGSKAIKRVGPQWSHWVE